jgi:hypothetical protein
VLFPDGIQPTFTGKAANDEAYILNSLVTQIENAPFFVIRKRFEVLAMKMKINKLA